MKSLENITREGAKNLNIEHELFKNVYNYYYKKHVIDNVVNATSTSIYVNKWGTFRFSMPKVIKEICRIVKELKISKRYWQDKEITIKAANVREKRLARLQQLLKLHNQLAIEAHKLRGGVVTSSWIKKAAFYKKPFKTKTN